MKTAFDSNGRAGRMVVLLGLVWLSLGACDWFMRFYWYRWHQTMVWRPFKTTEGPSAPMMRRDVPERSGGDLTQLVGIPDVAAEFAETHAAEFDYTDEYGYRNQPPTSGTYYPVVVMGSSYMAAGHPITNTFASRLSAQLDIPVYNHAYPGRGPFFGLIRYLESPRFIERPPRVLVWGVVEREVGGDVFEGLVYQLRNLGRYSDTGGAKAHVDWSALAPRRLKRSLPDTSAVAQLSARVWNQVRYRAFGWLTPDVAVSTGEVEGRRFLFYAPAVTALRWSPEERKVGQVVSAIQALDGHLAARGTKLVIVLIPDKEQVYRHLLPPRLLHGDAALPPSCLLDLEAGLREAGIPVVNELGPFEAMAAAGHMLYLRDDTHWDTEAIAMAAGRTSDTVRKLVERH